MKKALIPIILSGLIFNGCSNSNQDIFKQISKDKSFKLSDYKEYLKGAITDEREGVVILSYDMNLNGKMDLMAIAKIRENNNSKLSVSPYATSVSMNKDENESYEKYLFDKNGDGKFDMELEKK